MFLFLKQNPRRLKKQNQHNHRCDEANHDGVHFLAAEVFAVSFHLVDDVIRGYDPADEDRGEQGDQRHHEAVADVIHDIQQLAGGTVGQLHLKVEDAVAQGDDSGSGQVDDGQHQHGLFPAGVEDLHAVGCDGFQHGDAGGQRGKNRGDEKEDANHISGFSHACENFGKGDKHQAGACAHALGSGEHIDSRDDHGAGQKGYAGVKPQSGSPLY